MNSIKFNKVILFKFKDFFYNKTINLLFIRCLKGSSWSCNITFLLKLFCELKVSFLFSCYKLQLYQSHSRLLGYIDCNSPLKHLLGYLLGHFLKYPLRHLLGYFLRHFLKHPLRYFLGHLLGYLLKYHLVYLLGHLIKA